VLILSHLVVARLHRSRLLALSQPKIPTTTRNWRQAELANVFAASVRLVDVRIALFKADFAFRMEQSERLANIQDARRT
jgi:hypothetical protein